jgi:hypothetical protein
MKLRELGQPLSLTPGTDTWYPSDELVWQAEASVTPTATQQTTVSLGTVEGPLASSSSSRTPTTDALWVASLPKGQGKKLTTILAGAGPSHQMMPAKAAGGRNPTPLVIPPNSGVMAAPAQSAPPSGLPNSGPLYFPSTFSVKGGDNTEDGDDQQRSSTTNDLPVTSVEEGVINKNPPTTAEDSVMNEAESAA